MAVFVCCLCVTVREGNGVAAKFYIQLRLLYTKKEREWKKCDARKKIFVIKKNV